jgi:hypothetical protein
MPRRNGSARAAAAAAAAAATGCPVKDAAAWDEAAFDPSPEALVGLMSYAEGFPEKCQNALLALATDCASDSNPLVGRQPGKAGSKTKKKHRRRGGSRRKGPNDAAASSDEDGGGGSGSGGSSSGGEDGASGDDSSGDAQQGAPAAAAPAAAATSLSTTNGCCLMSCAATFKEAMKDGCIDKLMGSLCRDPAGAKYAAGL